MARDSSPFAKRLKKAISQRSAGQAQDAAPSAPEPPAAEGQADFAAAHEPETTAAPDAVSTPDEQPTGEFPAIDATDAPASPVPDAPVEPLGQTQSGPVADDEQPTGDVPVVSPSWLDPPAADPITPASITGVDQSGAPAPEPSHQVDWSSPAEDVYEPAPEAPAADAAPSSPYLPDPPAPIWEAEAAADPAATTDGPLPIWESIDASGPAGSPATPSSTDADDTTPAWAEEAEAIEPAGPVVPPPLTGYGEPTAETASSDGPTLSPPMLSKKETPVDEVSTHDAHEAALAALPDESEPEWTPTALHEALSLDEDEDEPVTEPVADGTPLAPADSTSAADAESPTPTTVPSPPAKRGLRSALGRRKRGASDPDPAGSDIPVGFDAESAADARSGAELGSTSEPETALYAAAPTPVDAPTPEPALVPDEASTSGRDDASDDTSEEPQAEPAARDEEPAVDPGSITSRFAAIGRRALSRKEAKAAAAAAAAQAATDAADYAATLPGATPEPEESAVPAPVVVDTPSADYKPTFAERAALRRRVKSLRARRDAGLAELGAIVLDQSRFGDPTGGTLVRRRTAVLADLDSEIAAIEAALDESGPPEAVVQLGVVHCASCSALVGPADRFCAACGTARPGADVGAASDAA